MGTYQVETEDGTYEIETEDAAPLSFEAPKDTSFTNEVLGVGNRFVEGVGGLADMGEAANRNLNPFYPGGPRGFGLNQTVQNAPPMDGFKPSDYIKSGAESLMLYGDEKPNTTPGIIAGEIANRLPNAAIPGALVPSLVGGAAAGGIKAAGGGEVAQAVADVSASGLTPLVTQKIGNAFELVNKWANSAPKVAGRMGATATFLDPEASKYVVPKVQELMDNSEFFNKQIVPLSDPGKQYEAAKAYQQNVGQQIGDFFATNKSIPVLRDEIYNSEGYQKILNISKNPSVSPTTRSEAIAVLQELEGSMPAGQKVFDLADVWTTRKDWDSKLVTSLYDKGTAAVPLNSQYISEITNALRETMEGHIMFSTRSAVPWSIPPEVANTLLKNNQEYSNISAVVGTLGRKVGQTSGKDILSNLASASASKILTPTDDMIRAGAARLGATGQSMALSAEVMNPYVNMGSALFPRTTDPNQINLEELKSSVFNKALTVIPPDQAQMLVEQLDQTFTNGSPMAKRQAMSTLTMQFPNLFEPTQDGLMSVVDNRIQDPFEKDMHLMAASELENPVDRARVIGKGIYDGGKYEPLDNTPPVPTDQIGSPNYSIDTIYNSLDNSYEVSPEMGSQLSQLEKATAIHAEDF